jgi:rubrerythrin
MENFLKVKWACRKCGGTVVSISEKNPKNDFCKCGMTSARLYDDCYFISNSKLKPKIIHGGTFNLMKNNVRSERCPICDRQSKEGSKWCSYHHDQIFS